MKMMMSLFLADAVLLASHYSLTFFTKLVQFHEHQRNVFGDFEVCFPIAHDFRKSSTLYHDFYLIYVRLQLLPHFTYDSSYL